jgi:Na+-transporting NADH:ubiquinone oxidoreductase subunit A
MQIKITKGLDLPLTGAPTQRLEPGHRVSSVALNGTDYAGLKPRMLVKEGDHVDLGQELFHDKRDPAVPFTAPGSGTVSSINRGARRALRSVVIELDSSPDSGAPFAESGDVNLTAHDRNDVRSALLRSGLWTALRTRPYSKVPHSNSTPQSIFVTAIDTRPLAADPRVVVDQHRDDFSLGLNVLRKLTNGSVHLCTGIDWNGPTGTDPQIRHTKFAGPHPAGLAGTHIHHLNPVGANSMVWHIGYQDVIACGKLFGTGAIWTERIVALGGSAFTRPRLVTTRLGANLTELLDGELATGTPTRLISGSVLNGRSAEGGNAFLGRYDVQVSAIRNTGERRLFGWLGIFDGNYSFASRIARRQNQATLHDFSTAQFGRPTAMVAIDAFDRVMPMDILPVPLLRALLIRDTDQAQALGCLELDAEDLALCSFVCPGKNDYGHALNLNLAQIERDG